MPGFSLAPGADATTVAAHLDAIEQNLALSRHAERVVLAAGEMLSNAAEHGAGSVEVEWESLDGTVSLTITGPGPEASHIRTALLPGPRATRGRGLFLVNTLSSSVTDVPGGIRLDFI